MCAATPRHRSSPGGDLPPLPPDLRHRAVRDVMRKDFVSVAADETLLEALRIMQLARLRHLLVERDGTLVGILTYRSLQDRALSHLDAPPEIASMERLAVEEAMVDSPYAVTPDAPLGDAATRLLRLGVGCLPVVENADDRPRLVGILTESDLLRAAYEGV